MRFNMGGFPPNRHIVVAQRRLLTACSLMDEKASIEPGCAVARLLAQQRIQMTDCKVVATGRQVQTRHIVPQDNALRSIQFRRRSRHQFDSIDKFFPRSIWATLPHLHERKRIHQECGVNRARRRRRHGLGKLL